MCFENYSLYTFKLLKNKIPTKNKCLSPSSTDLPTKFRKIVLTSSSVLSEVADVLDSNELSLFNFGITSIFIFSRTTVAQCVTVGFPFSHF